jgi:hypothetical protein
MKRIYTSVILLLLSAGFSYSQEESHGMGGGGFIAGYANFDASPLHAFVTDEIGSFTNHHLVMGGTGFGINGKLVIGGTGYAIMGGEIITETLRINLNGGFGTFDLGYLMINEEQVKLFPKIGIGAGSYGLDITNTGTISSDDIAADPGQAISIGRPYFVGDFSLNLIFLPLVAYDPSENTHGGLMSGLQIGVTGGIPTEGWSYQGGAINGGPEMDMFVLYARIVIGGFGY